MHGDHSPTGSGRDIAQRRALVVTVLEQQRARRAEVQTCGCQELPIGVETVGGPRRARAAARARVRP